MRGNKTNLLIRFELYKEFQAFGSGLDTLDSACLEAAYRASLAATFSVGENTPLRSADKVVQTAYRAIKNEL